MRIIISRNVSITDSSTGAEITDPERLKALDGLSYEEMLISDFISDPMLNDLEINGGGIALRFEPIAGKLRVISEFSASRRLRKKELEKLVDNTQGQWSDGIGEDAGTLFPSLGDAFNLDLCFGESDLRVEQINDTKGKPRRRTLARAAEKGDVEAIRKAIEAGEDVNSQLGGVASLQLAIMKGQADAAIFLIEHGADLKPPHIGGYSPLVDCATWLNEDAAIRVSAAIIAKGGSADISTAYGKANEKWKMALAQFLVDHGADPHYREKETQRELERLQKNQKKRHH